MDVNAFAKLSPTTLADVLTRDRVMAHRARVEETLKALGLG